MQNKTLQNATLFIIFYGDASLHNYFYDNWLCSIKIQSQVQYSKLRGKINFQHQRSNLTPKVRSVCFHMLATTAAEWAHLA